MNKLWPWLLRLFISLLLAVLTILLICATGDLSRSETFGWLVFWPTAGLSLVIPIVVIIGVDALWLLYFVLWVVRQRFVREDPTF